MVIPARKVDTYVYQESEQFYVCEINGSKFALFNDPITSYGDLVLELSDCNAVFLVPLKAKDNIFINARSVIVLTTLNTEKGKIEIEASEKVILLGSKITSLFDNKIRGNKGVFSYEIRKERREVILKEFKEAISAKNGLAVVDALADTFDAATDPNGESEDPSIDMTEAFNFFNIPLSIYSVDQACQFINFLENNTCTLEKASTHYDELFKIISSNPKDNPEFLDAAITIFSLIHKLKFKKIIDPATYKTWFDNSYEKLQIYTLTDPELKDFLDRLMEGHVKKDLATMSIK